MELEVVEEILKMPFVPDGATLFIVFPFGLLILLIPK
jgi:hypothetical protein